MNNPSTSSPADGPRTDGHNPLPSTRGPWTAAVVGSGLAAAGPLWIATRWGSLPGRLASHWNAQGVADGSMTRSMVVAIAVLSAAVAIGAFVFIALRPQLGSGVLGLFVVAELAMIFVAASVLTVLAARQGAEWRSTPGPTLVSILFTLVAPTALVAWNIRGAIRHHHDHDHEHDSDHDRGASSDVPALDTTPSNLDRAGLATLSPTQHIVWTSRLTSWAMAAPPILLVLGGVVAFASGVPVLGVGLIGIGIATTVLASITVRADRSGLTIGYGPGGFIRTRVPVQRIESASATEIRPMEWGGWGYRGSLRLMGQAAVVLRKGPGIVLTLTDGSRFAVTVDNPEGGVAVLNAVLAAGRTGVQAEGSAR